MQKPKIEQPIHAVDGNVTNSVVSRRAVLQAAAWTLPAVAIAVGTPALAASVEDPPVPEGFGWYWSQFQVGADGNRTLNARTQMNLDTRGGTVPPFTAFMTVRFEVFRDSELTSLLLDRTETFEYAYAGTNGETSPDGLIRLRHEFTAEEWPPSGDRFGSASQCLRPSGLMPTATPSLLSEAPLYRHPTLTPALATSAPGRAEH